MLTISRSLVRRVRNLFARAVGRSARLAPPPVLFQSDGATLTIAVRIPEVVIEFQQPTAGPPGLFVLPFDILKRIEGSRDEPVTLESRGDDQVLAWNEAGIPQSVTLPRGEAFERPPRPERMMENPPRLLTALRDAAVCTDTVATRYALSCLQLKGDGGRIAATDGRRLLVQWGFAFPWSDERLIPGSSVFASAELDADQPVSIGSTDDGVTLATGPWTIYLKLQKESRFPQVDAIIPQAAQARSVLRIDPADGRFLRQALPRLPGQTETESPITVDLNGHVAIRSRGGDQPKPTELRLSNSRLDGPPIVVQMNRTFLAHALQLGFTEVRLYEPHGTVLCEDDHRQLIWMLLGPDGAVPADSDLVRIESPAGAAVPPAVSRVSSSSSFENRVRPVPSPPISSVARTVSVPPETPDALCRSTAQPSAVESLTLLRETLKAAMTQTTAAIAALKRQRREDRLVRSTLASLRQLQGIAP